MIISFNTLITGFDSLIAGFNSLIMGFDNVIASFETLIIGFYNVIVSLASVKTECNICPSKEQRADNIYSSDNFSGDATRKIRAAAGNWSRWWWVGKYRFRNIWKEILSFLAV